jgi:hypothetical protein
VSNGPAELLRRERVTTTSFESHNRPGRWSPSNRLCDEEDHVSISNAAVADRALELAVESCGLRRWAALCVSFAAGTTGTVGGAGTALEVIPLPDLRGAAQSLLTELAADPATTERAAATPRHARNP